MNKGKAVALGVRALKADQEARWDYGDALLLYGWPVGQSGAHSGGIAIAAEFREAVAEKAGIDINTLPSAGTLTQYGCAAAAVTSRHRRGVSIFAAHEAVRGSDNPLDLLERVRRTDGKVTVNGVRRQLGNKPTSSTTTVEQVIQEAPLEEVERALMDAPPERRREISAAVADTHPARRLRPNFEAQDRAVEADERTDFLVLMSGSLARLGDATDALLRDYDRYREHARGESLDLVNEAISDEVAKLQGRISDPRELLS